MFPLSDTLTLKKMKRTEAVDTNLWKPRLYESPSK